MDPDIVERLRRHRTIGSAPAAELEWIAAHGRLRSYPAGAVIFTRQEVVDGLFIVFSGRFSIYVTRPGGQKKMMEWTGGDVSGLLPYSRMKTPPGETITEEPTETLWIPREDLPDLSRNCYTVTSILVHEMTDRARWFTVSDLRDEKLTSLGKLAAGLAHELNNPASALVRDAKTLSEHLNTAAEATWAILDAGLSKPQRDVIRDLVRPGRPAKHHDAVTGLAVADREDVLVSWLEERGINTALAPDLARISISDASLARLAASLQGVQLERALGWIVARSIAGSLVVDIERAATRIHSLVASVRGFTHLDHGPEKGPVDVVAGLEDTKAILEGKARGKSVSVTLTIPPELPPVVGHTVEINQVWMNLLDNAIDAVPQSGHVDVTVAREGPCLVVTVVDDGPGIPPEIAGNIFDPFFTTKDVGEGTGLGLDIVRRIVHSHRGEVDFESRPGRTSFRVKLPVAGRA